MRVFSFGAESMGLRLLFLILIWSIIILLFLLDQRSIPSWLQPIRTFAPIIFALSWIFVFHELKLVVAGSDAETDAKRILDKLPSTYFRVSDFVDGKKGNVDDIVVGPTGVWTIEVKSHDGNITFEGDALLRNDNPFEKDFLSQSYAESKAVEEFVKEKINLNLAVNPVLVFTNQYAKIHFGFDKQKGVYVVGGAWLLKLIQNESLGHTLSAEQCKQIYDELKKYSSVI